MAYVSTQTFTLPLWNHGGTTGKLRIFASQPFYEAATGAFIPQGQVTNIRSACAVYDTTVSGTVMTIPEVTLATTTDSTVPNAVYTALVYDQNDVPQYTLLSQFFLDVQYFQSPPQSSVLVTDAGTTAANQLYTYRGQQAGDPYYNVEGEADSVTLSALVNTGSQWRVYNAAGTNLYHTSNNPDDVWDGTWVTGSGSSGSLPIPTVAEDATLVVATWEQITLSNQASATVGLPYQWNGPFWNVEQTKQYVNSVVGDGTTPFASRLRVGKTALDVDPEVSTFPVAVGSNSPRLPRNLYSDYNNSLATAFSEIGSDPVTLTVSRPADTLLVNKSFGSNVVFEFTDSGILPIASGITLTIGAMLEPGNYQQCFDLADATSVVRFAKGAVPYINVAWYMGIPGLMTVAMNQALNSCAFTTGGVIYVPGGDWTCGTTDTIENTSNVIIFGDGEGVTVIKPSGAGVRTLTFGENFHWGRVQGLTLDGDGLSNCRGILCTGADPAQASGDLVMRGVRTINFTHASDNSRGFEVLATDVDESWQFINIDWDKESSFWSNDYFLECNSANTNFNGPGYVWVEAGKHIATLDKCGPMTFSTTEFAGQGTYGNTQVETQTIGVSGAVTAGRGKSVVTVPGQTWSPKTVYIPVAGGESASDLGALWRKYLGEDADVSSFFHFAGSTNVCKLLCLDAAANVSGINFTVENDTSTNITTNLTSTTEVSGTADNLALGFLINAAHSPFNFNGTIDEGFHTFLEVTANDLGSTINFNGATIQSAVRLTQGQTVNTTNCNVFDRAIRQGVVASLYNSIGDVVPSSSNFHGSGVVALTELQTHNFSDKGIAGLVVSPTNQLIKAQYPVHAFHNSATNTRPQTEPVTAAMSSFPGGSETKPLRYMGRCDESGNPTFGYNEYREGGTGFWIQTCNQTAFGGQVANFPKFAQGFMPDAVTATAISADTNNYDPGGGLGFNYNYGIWRVAVTGTRNLTGIVAPTYAQTLVSGRSYCGRFINVSTGTLTVINQSASSTAANRIICPNSADFSVPPNGAFDLYYDLTSSRFRAFPAISAVTFPLNANQIADGSVSNTEFQYLDGVTSAIQGQFTAKAPIASPTFTGTVTAPTLVATNSALGTATGTQLTATGLIKSSGTAGVGYTSGASGSVNSGTWGSSVTLNKICGEVIMDSASFSANTSYHVEVQNNTITTGDVVIVNLVSGAASPDTYQVQAINTTTGTFTIMMRAYTNPTEALTFRFAVIKGS